MEKIEFRKIEDNVKDYKLLEKWYKDKEVYTYFEQRILSYDEIYNKYYPRSLSDSEKKVFMILYDNKEIGIVQFYKVNSEDKEIYGVDNLSYEVDIFIGDSNYRNKGLGSITINKICEYIFNNYECRSIVMVPLLSNKRAIDCYLKCGFKKIKELSLKDSIGNVNSYILMVKYI